MVRWAEFVESAPRVAEVFTRRHAAAGSLCMLATLRSDGFPRISPLEPRTFEGGLWIGGRPGTYKFRDLARDARFSLHTATIDRHVSDGGAKLWGVVHDVPDTALHQGYAEWLYGEIGLDLRGERFGQYYAAKIGGASWVEIRDGHLDITIWIPGGPERVERKH
jgi:hypothetical protein